MDRARGLRRRSQPRARFLPAHPRLLAGAAGRLAHARLLRDQAEAHGPGGGSGGFHDRGAAAARARSARPPVRHRVAGSYLRAVARRGGHGLPLRLNAFLGISDPPRGSILAVPRRRGLEHSPSHSKEGTMQIIRREFLALSGLAVAAPSIATIALAQAQAGPKLTQILRKEDRKSVG